jgi:NAD(P)-dependent dehydrogenase (short-subunit alcohol dehydrogenase family)
MSRSYVVTGGGRGVGLAIVERLLADGGSVAVVELDSATLTWTSEHPASDRIAAVIGSAADESVAERAADEASRLGEFTGWVNNAAVFTDATLTGSSAIDVMQLITANLAPAVVGCAMAVRTFLRAGTAGSIVNISSHQAQRAVRGAMPYATAKAALEGLTRAVAVDYGSAGIRANAVALGSISTERYEDLLREQGPEAAARMQAQMALLHPLGRVGTVDEVASAVAYLLSDEASFISGVVLPIDGGRAARGADPEET